MLGLGTFATQRAAFSRFQAKVSLHLKVGRFVIKTISTENELEQAFLLRYQVFQVEMQGYENQQGLDKDEFDPLSDHLGIFDTRSQQLIATCRLNSSLFSQRFYSEQEFDCQSLTQGPGTKLEIGRVCVRQDYRSGIVIMLLWKAIAAYLQKTDTQILFGCGSVMTENPADAFLLYRYIQEEGKLERHPGIRPTLAYQSDEFESLAEAPTMPLSDAERQAAKELLPSLCQSYFDIGCYTPCGPAFDRDFRCIDFLTVLDMDRLDPKVRNKMMGGR